MKSKADPLVVVAVVAILWLVWRITRPSVVQVPVLTPAPPPSVSPPPASIPADLTGGTESFFVTGAPNAPAPLVAQNVEPPPPPATITYLGGAPA